MYLYSEFFPLSHCNFTADTAATDWNAVAVDYNHYPTTQYANSGPYGTSIGATYEYSGGVNDHRPESPSDDKVKQIHHRRTMVLSTFKKNDIIKD